MAKAHIQHGQAGAALPVLQKCVRLCEPESEELATVLNNLGGVHRHLDQLHEAQACFKQSLDIRSEALSYTTGLTGLQPPQEVCKSAHSTLIV